MGAQTLKDVDNHADSSERDETKPKSITLETKDDDDNNTKKLFNRHGTNNNTNNSSRQNASFEQSETMDGGSPPKLDDVVKSVSSSRNSEMKDCVDSENGGQDYSQQDAEKDSQSFTENKSNNESSRATRKERPEWDMFADQDVDSTFDVSVWIVNVAIYFFPNYKLIKQILNFSNFIYNM